MPEEETILLTQDAYDKMKKELDHLEGEVRSQIAQKIKEARAEGDLSENGGYQAAKEAQGKNEGRIAELTQKLRSARIMESPRDGKAAKEVREGSVVKLKVGSQEGEFLLGVRDLSCTTDKKIISAKSPIGAAILNHSAGETVSYEAPGGRKMEVEILSVAPLSEA
ncbi:MAG: transcription elongation factor GreA [Aeriscardovia sp.]|nr:transcription elongation factor GreA [Aeriscardovia sp.]